MYCAYCGEQLRDDSAFCDACGQRVKNNGEYICGRVSETPVQNPTGRGGDKSMGIFGVILIMAVGIFSLGNIFFMLSSYLHTGKALTYWERLLAGESLTYTDTYTGGYSGDTYVDDTYTGDAGTVDDTYTDDSYTDDAGVVDDTYTDDAGVTDDSYSGDAAVADDSNTDDAVVTDDSYSDTAEDTLVQDEMGVYHIDSPADLASMAENLDGAYVLDSNIDASAYEEGWTAIGTEAAPFTGSLDGQGYSIYGLSSNASVDDSISFGLFGVIQDAQISNVWISGAYYYITAYGSTDQFANVGGIAGEAYSSTITNCYVSGDVTACGDGNSYARAGGITGAVDNGSTIQNCAVSGTVSALCAAVKNAMAGGISGWCNGSSSVVNCADLASISADGSMYDDEQGYAYAAGIVASGEEFEIRGCGVFTDSITSSWLGSIISPFGTQSTNYTSGYVTLSSAETQDNDMYQVDSSQLGDTNYLMNELGWESGFADGFVRLYQA